MADESIKNNNEIAQVLGIVTQDITKWTKRWVQSDIKDVEERLKDKARSGRPSRITAEQWCNIMALACETPESYGVPITHWSHSTLTKEILKQGIVDENILAYKLCASPLYLSLKSSNQTSSQGEEHLR